MSVITDAIEEHLPVIACTALAVAVGLCFQLSIDLKGESVFTPQFLWEFMLVFMAAPFVIGFIRVVRALIQGKTADAIGAEIRDVFSVRTLARVVVCCACAFTVITVFGAVKSLIGSHLTPHGHDYLFIAIERFLHFGRLPHEYFDFVYDNPIWLHRIDFLYWLWFMLMYVFLAWVVFQKPGTPGRMQYIVSFCLCWTVIGNILAAAGASAGPIFWQYYLPDPDPYESLLARIDAISADDQLFRNRFRDIMLWMTSNDKMVDMNGPAALPSVHVAMATLFTLHSFKYWPWLAWPMLVYAIVIQLGSFLLSWHYAIDGYVGAAVMILIWWAAGRYFDRKQTA